MNSQIKVQDKAEFLRFTRPNRLIDMWRVLRPKQWIKNLFVFLGIIFSANWHDLRLLVQASWTAAAFCFVASAIYVLNDLFDRQHDRKHPMKRWRPVAAGKVTPGRAGLLFLLSAASGLAVGAAVSPWVTVLLLFYLGLNIAYSKLLKKIVIIDVFVIALGFILRILAGTWGIGIPPSRWMLLCGLMLTLFMGFGKRWAELSELARGAVFSRPVLGSYSLDVLNQFTGITAGGVIITYSCYTLDPATVALHNTDKLIYTIPFVIYGVFRYLYLIHTGQGGDPAKLVAKDPHVIGAVVLWLGSVMWILS